VSLTLVIADQSFDQLVTGCVINDPEPSSVLEIYDLITKY
jgi:hypothetical protein